MPHVYFRACAMFRGGEEERGKIIGECVAAFPYMWFYVSSPGCLSCLLPADCLCLPVCECWSLFILFTACWPPLSLFSRVWVLLLFVLFTACWPFSASACQGVSAVPYLFCLLFADLPLSLLTRLWVPLIYPVCCLLTSLPVSAFQLVNAAPCSVCCLLIYLYLWLCSPACESQPAFILLAGL